MSGYGWLWLIMVNYDWLWLWLWQQTANSKQRTTNNEQRTTTKTVRTVRVASEKERKGKNRVVERERPTEVVRKRKEEERVAKWFGRWLWVADTGSIDFQWGYWWMCEREGKKRWAKDGWRRRKLRKRWMVVDYLDRVVLVPIHSYSRNSYPWSV